LHVATHRVVIPAQAGIQSQQHIRHTGEGRYPVRPRFPPSRE
jgi:hypothetical protein